MKLYTEFELAKAYDKGLHDGIFSHISSKAKDTAMKELKPIELPSDEEIVKVKATIDESGHWYVIPNELVTEFHKDELNEDMIDSGEFDNKWGCYMTGGDLNLVQLYAKKEQILNQNK